MTKRDLSSVLLYIFGFLLLWEWLRPLEQLTDTDHIEVFVVFMLLCFLASYVRLKWGIQWGFKILYILIWLDQFYYKNHFLKNFLLDLKEDSGDLFARNWDSLSNEFRTLLFFILIWLMVYLIHYWLLNRRRIFIFFFMTIVYISVLDTFTPYDAKAAIVRTIICGFSVMGMLTFYRIRLKEKMVQDRSVTRKWMVPLTIMIAVSVLLGFAAPKAAPIWPDPVPYIQSASNKDEPGRHGSVGKIGYGEDDSKLGGPFVGDASIVFKVISDGKNYWKVETKDKYTGKGWMASGSGTMQFEGFDLVPVFSIPDEVIKTGESASIFSQTEENYLIYPAGIKRIVPSAIAGEIFSMNTNTEKINSFDKDNNPHPLNGYTVSYEVPKYKAADLLKITDDSRGMMSEEFIKRYTDLPKDLPPRIRQLAEEITAGKTNWFDKAKAIENYFDRPDYLYDQKNVATPGAGDDYVDQFLFETKRGYCNNFSTSMAVMLRTLGIPTRWVKGYTGGQFLQYNKEDSSKQLYEISNNNAHSWVEVFFPNQGWVPFEPTKGFSNTVNISYLGNETKTNEQKPVVTPEKEKPQKPLEEDAKLQSEKKAFDYKQIFLRIETFFENNWGKIALSIGALGVFTILLYRIRGKWVPYYLVILYRFKKDDLKLALAYLSLLKQLERYGLKRKKDQTLRNYAQYIDNFFSTREMTRLTSYYEKLIYKESLPKESWDEVSELWENLIKRTIT